MKTKLFQCSKCGLFYKDKSIAEKCRKWCAEHKSCNLEIIKHAVKKINRGESCVTCVISI